MARVDKLSATQVAKTKGPAVLHDGGGLYLRVSPVGARSWVFRYQLDGKRRDMGLGPYPDVSLSDARRRATEYRNQRRDGVDPLDAKAIKRRAQRLAESRTKTFRQVAEELLSNREAGWRNKKHRDQVRSTLRRYVFPVIGDLPVAAIDTDRVLEVLRPIWSVIPETANRIRGRIESILDAARARHYREDENPARWRGHLDTWLAAKGKLRNVKHHSALPYVEMPTFMDELRGRNGVSARALEFSILTAGRTAEALGARWGEIDFAEKIWTIPADRMKAGKEHRVPLSDPALVTLKMTRQFALTINGQVDPAAPVFPGIRRAVPLSPSAMIKLLKVDMGRRDLTVHGFRSTFRDWGAEQNNSSRETLEAALAHAIQSKTEAAYRRGDLFEKRRELMQEWAKFCNAPTLSSKVVSLHAISAASG